MLEENNPEIKNIFAITLENLIYSEYLIFERYLNSQDVLNNIFSNLLLKKFVNVLDTSKLLNQLSLTYWFIGKFNSTYNILNCFTFLLIKLIKNSDYVLKEYVIIY